MYTEFTLWFQYVLTASLSVFSSWNFDHQQDDPLRVLNSVWIQTTGWCHSARMMFVFAQVTVSCTVLLITDGIYVRITIPISSLDLYWEFMVFCSNDVQLLHQKNLAVQKFWLSFGLSSFRTPPVSYTMFQLASK